MRAQHQLLHMVRQACKHASTHQARAATARGRDEEGTQKRRHEPWKRQLSSIVWQSLSTVLTRTSLLARASCQEQMRRNHARRAPNMPRADRMRRQLFCTHVKHAPCQHDIHAVCRGHTAHGTHRSAHKTQAPHRIIPSFARSTAASHIPLRHHARWTPPYPQQIPNLCDPMGSGIRLIRAAASRAAAPTEPNAAQCTATLSPVHRPPAKHRLKFKHSPEPAPVRVRGRMTRGRQPSWHARQPGRWGAHRRRASAPQWLHGHVPRGGTQPPHPAVVHFKSS